MNQIHRKAQPHHEYQIYYGGFKKKLKRMYFCETCNQVLTKLQHQIIRGSHKKQTGLTRIQEEIYTQGGKYVLPKKN